MKFVPYAIGVLAFSLTANIAQAQMFDLSFHRITENNTIDIANQLSATVLDESQAKTDFGSFTKINNMNNDEVLFTFTNNVGTSSNLSEIYFDVDTTISQISIVKSLGGLTNFSNVIKPEKLPGSTSTEFSATSAFGADAKGNTNNGINSSIDILGIIIKLQSGLSFSDLQQSLSKSSSKGKLQIGLHVHSIGRSGGLSDSFVNNPFNADLDPSLVPIPAAMWLFGPALLALPGVIRRKSV